MDPTSDSAPWQPPGSSTGLRQIPLPLGNKASALGSDELTRLITAQCRRIPLQEWESQALLDNCRRRQALDKGLAILYEYAGHMDRVKFLTERQSSLATDLENALLLTQTHASSGEIGAIFKSLVETNVAVILEIAYWRRIQWCPSPVLVRPAGEDKNAKKLTIQSKLRKQVSQILPNLQKHLPMLEASSPDHLAFFLAPCFTFDQAKSYFVGELKAVFTIEQIFIAARNIFFLEDGVASTYRSFHPKGSSSSLTVSPYKSFPVLRLVYPGFSFPTEQFKWFWDADSVYQSSSEVLIHSVGQIGTKPLFHLGSSSTVQGNVQTVGFLQQQQQQQQEKQKEEDEQAALRFPESSLADVSYTMDHGVLSAPYFMLPDQLEAGSSVQVVSMVAALMGEEGGPQSLTPPPSAATAKALAAKNKEEQELQQLEEELALAKLRTEEKRQLQLQLQQEEEALALSLAEEKQRLDNLLRLERERSAAKVQAEETLRRQKEEELAAAKADVEERRAAAKAEAEEKQRREKEERATAKAEMKKQEDEEKRRGAELKKQQEDDKKRIAAAAAPSSKKTSTKQSQPSSRPQQQPQQQSENISRLEEEVALTKARAEEKLREEAALTLSLAEEKRCLEEQEKLRQDSLLRLGAELAQTKARAEENLRLQRAEEEALALSLAEEKQRLNNLLRLERERSAAKVQAEAEETLRRQTEEEERRTSSAAQKKAASSAAVVAAAAASATATTAITTTSTTAELRLQSSPHHEHVSRKFVAALVQDGLTSTVATRSRSVSPTEREPPVSPSPAAPKHPHLVAAAKEVSTPFAASSVPDDTPSSDPSRVRSSPIISKGHAVLRDSSFGTINLNLALNSRQSFSPKDILGAENKRWRALRCGSKKVAVVIIQTRMRMVLAKKKAARKRESLNEERRHNKRVKALADPTNKRTNAAVMIQRHARGMWSRTRVFLLIKAAMVLNTAYRRNQSFVHLRRNLRRVERPLLITVRGLLNVPASVYNSSSTLRVKVSVYWSPMLHILHASEVKQVIQGKFPQFTMTTAASELKRVFTPEEQEARMRANMSRTSSMMFSLRSSSPRADAENEGNDDDDSSSSSSEGDPEKVEEESASTKYRLYLKLPKITKSIKSVTSKLTRRFSSAIVPKVKRPTIPGTAKCMSVFDETIKVPSCHGNSVIKFEILNDANRRVTSAVFLLAQHGRLMFWEAEEKIPLPLGTMRRLIAGSDGDTQKMLEALDSPMLEVSVRSGAALRSKAGWGKLRIHGHGPIRAAIGASKDAQIINFVWEVWNRFYFSLDGGVLGAYAGKSVCEPIFTVECASITSCVSEKGEMIILEEGVARTSTDDSHNVFITIKNSIETLIFRFGDSGSRVQWVECLSKIVEDNEKNEAEEDVKAASAKPGQGSPPQRRGSNNMPASSEKAPSSSTKSISGDGQPGPSLQSPTSSSSSAASLQLPDLERQARQASRRSSSATPAGVKNMLPGVDSESLKALQSYHHKAQSFRSK